MATTPNLGLYKPNRLDSVEVDVSLAQNFDTVDTEVHGVKGRLTTVEAEMTTLNSSQTASTQTANAAMAATDSMNTRLTTAEADIEELKVNGTIITLIDGGTF